MVGTMRSEEEFDDHSCEIDGNGPLDLIDDLKQLEEDITEQEETC